MKVAFLFPGQGAQAVGMGSALAAAYPVARDTFESADRALGFAFSALLWGGPEDELRKTMNAQPALLTHSVAAWRLVEQGGLKPAFVAGHSLGEYSACVAAGALSFEEALKLTRRRGELMYQAGLERPGAMAAILGLAREQIEAVCDGAAAAGLVKAANLNAPGQVVISGEVAGVERACELAKAAGARRVLRLGVTGAFHSPLMASAATGLAEALDAAPLRDARCPVIANVSGEPMRKADEIRTALKGQLLAPVRWEDSMRRLIELGAGPFVELGTGKVLRGLLRALSPTAISYNVDDPGSLTATLAAIGAAPAERTT
ncbi:MAG: ACP S-malonyltransferase [Candidatus Eisenbacteria bacterium]|nr:ACP S-malonyltransferase [Candidatus Eisenbacteria bacterium]